MKKIPVLLSTMTVVGSLGLGALLPGTTLTYAKDAEINLMAAAEDIGYIYTEAIYPARQQVDIRGILNSGWFVKRIIVSGLDYENGFTESDAEAGWNDIGLEKADWELRFADYETNGSSDVWLTLKNGGLSANRTRVLYYAVLVGEGTRNSNGVVEWAGEETWIRGKMDYRSCAASSVFNEATMYCLNRSSLQDTPVYVPYLSNGKPVETIEGEEIRSWEQEWREIQEKRLSDTRSEMSNLERYLTNALSMLDMADQTLGGLEITLPNTTWADEMTINQVHQLQQTVAYLQSYYKNINVGGGQDEELLELQRQISELENERVELLAQLEEAKGELGRLQEENSTLRDENGVLRDENNTLRNEVGVLEDDKRELLAKIELCGTNNDDSGGLDGSNIDADTGVVGGGISNVVASNNVGVNGSNMQDITPKATFSPSEGSSEINLDQMAENDKNALDGQLVANEAKNAEIEQEEISVEVPKLGVAGVRAWWWLLIPLLVCLGSLGFRLKRAVSNRKI